MSSAGGATSTGRTTMQGTMLWFNLEKGYGFIQTEDGERLYVARGDFLPQHEPMPRCKGQEVTFQRQVGEGDTRAVEVSFVSRDQPMRARLRTPRSGRTLY
jgi:cold shock CspA family protein